MLLQSEVTPNTAILALAFWLGIALLFGWWGKTRAEQSGAPGWLGFVVVFCISTFLSPLIALISIFLLVPVISASYNRVERSRRPTAKLPRRPQLHERRDYSGTAKHTDQVHRPDGTGKVQCPSCGARINPKRRACVECGALMRE